MVSDLIASNADQNGTQVLKDVRRDMLIITLIIMTVKKTVIGYLPNAKRTITMILR